MYARMHAFYQNLHRKFIWADNDLEITQESNIYKLLHLYLSCSVLPVVLFHTVTFCGLTKVRRTILRIYYLLDSQ